MYHRSDYMFLEKGFCIFEIFWLLCCGLFVFALTETYLNALSKKVSEMSRTKNVDCHSHKYIIL